MNTTNALNSSYSDPMASEDIRIEERSSSCTVSLYQIFGDGIFNIILWMKIAVFYSNSLPSFPHQSHHPIRTGKRPYVALTLYDSESRRISPNI